MPTSQYLLLLFCSSSEYDEFSDQSTTEESAESKMCEPRRNIASGISTGLEVFISLSNPEDSLRETQYDKSGVRVSCFQDC
jgi:hypothetical protein